jgi:16S rRNA (guanine(966)-N(2))-methyltransferase RsmD
MRPSSDRLRETLFNILGEDVKDSVFVDLFAGSGAVGIEALSRGAKRSIFVERNPDAIKLLQQNLDSLGIALPNSKVRTLGGAAEIVSTDAVAALDHLAQRGVTVDIIFADPPYADEGAYTHVLEWLGNSELIEPGGKLVVEHSRRKPLPALSGTLERVRVLEQGDSALSFYNPVLAA